MRKQCRSYSCKSFSSKNRQRILQDSRTQDLDSFFLLPKIHKPKQKWYITAMPPGWSIVAVKAVGYQSKLTFIWIPCPPGTKVFWGIPYDFDKVKTLAISPESFLFSLDKTVMWSSSGLWRFWIIATKSIKKTTTNATSIDFMGTTTYKGPDFATTQHLDLISFSRRPTRMSCCIAKVSIPNIRLMGYCGRSFSGSEGFAPDSQM